MSERQAKWLAGEISNKGKIGFVNLNKGKIGFIVPHYKYWLPPMSTTSSS
jgi:hypothetical protein